MPTSIKKLQVFRFVIHGLYDLLLLEIKTNKNYRQYGSRRTSGLTEEESANKLANDFVREYKINYYKEQIILGFQQLRLRDVKGVTYECINIPVLPVLPHSSCNMGYIDDSMTERKENKVSQCDLKIKLKAVDKNSEVFKFFEGNKCSVCLSNYKEIVDEYLHIVVPSCGHPLCCSCADDILARNKKECPICTRNFTGQSFDLLKFNADLTVKTEGRLFL